MKIFVLVKLVPDTECSLRIDESGKEIVADGLKMILNPFDEYAVEEAVRLVNEIPGSSNIVVTMGNESVNSALVNALAMGITDAVRIDDPDAGDCFKTASVLAGFMAKQEFDLILVGKQAFGDDASSVGALLAEFLGIPFVSNIVGLEVVDEKTLRVTREKEVGADIVEVSLPCALSCQKGLNRPRYPKLMRLMKARKKKIPAKTFAALGFKEEDLKKFVKTKVLGLSTPQTRAGGKTLTGEPREIATNLIRIRRLLCQNLFGPLHT